MSDHEIEMTCNLYRNLRSLAAKSVAEARLEDGIAPETKQIWQEMGDIPVSDRAAWVRSSECSDRRDDLYFIRRERETVPDDEDRDGSRLHEQPIKRIYGKRNEIISATAEGMSTLLGRPVSDQQVIKALKSFLKTDPI